jgi:ubiquinone/menaquinone biosynthesis C-methylase UbiE
MGELRAEGTLIDVACGTGELLRLLYDTMIRDDSLRCKCIGVEPSPEMLERARKKFESKRPSFEIDLKNSPAEHIPIPNACGDCLVCTNAFHFFRDKKQALKEMKRVLKTDGKIIITDWCNNYFIVKLYHWMERMRWNWRFKDKYPGPLTRDELIDLVQSAGFESLVISTYRVRVFSIFFWGMQTITAIKR